MEHNKTKETSIMFTSAPLLLARELRILAAHSGGFTYKLDPPQFGASRYGEETSTTRQQNILTQNSEDEISVCV
jgi:hypothetical protein